jgi:hypothetical protein
MYKTFDVIAEALLWNGFGSHRSKKSMLDKSGYLEERLVYEFDESPGIRRSGSRPLGTWNIMLHIFPVGIPEPNQRMNFTSGIGKHFLMVPWHSFPEEFV